MMFYGIYIKTYTIKQITRIYVTTLNNTNIRELVDYWLSYMLQQYRKIKFT